jgi:hypothetical protein
MSFMDPFFESSNHTSDLERILAGMETFVGLNFAQIRDHFEAHKEDALCDLRHPNGKGIVLCTRDALQAVTGIAASLLQRSAQVEYLEGPDLGNEPTLVAPVSP